MELNRKEKKKLVIILSALSTIAPLSIGMHLPAVKAIVSDFATTEYMVGFLLSAYFFGLTVGHLFFGVLSDRWGRKKSLCIGFILYTVSGLSCIFAPTITWLIVSRFFLALGACSGVVVSRAIVRDLFGVKESAKFFSIMMVLMAIAPIIAPSIGGIVVIYFGWQYVFFFLISIVFALFFAVYCFLPPTKGEDPSVIVNIKEILLGYFTILKNPTFLAYGLIGGITYAAFFGYIGGSQHIYMHIFGLNEKEYSWSLAINAIGFILGTQLNHFLLKKYSNERVTHFALVIFCMATATLLLYEIYSILTLSIFMIFTFFCISLLGILNPNTLALALSPFTTRTGRSSALAGSIQMVISAIITIIISYLHSHSILPILICIGSCAFGGLLIAGIYLLKHKNLSIEH